jgi:AraC-like DNA-binding protein
MPGPTFHYGEATGPDSIKPWLWNYWEFRVESDGSGPVLHHVPPDGSTSIAIVVAAGVVRHLAASGPWLAPLVLPVMPDCQYWGVRFRPEAAGLVLGVAPDKLRDRNQLMDQLSPELARSLRGALAEARDFDQAIRAMDRVFIDHLRQVDAPDPIVRAGVDRLVESRGEEAIAALAGALGVAQRTLLRRFRGATGLTPKQFARICRFRHAAMKLVETGRPDWAQVASGTGFADQAHMINEFKDLTGLTPEGLSARVRKTSHGDLVV